MRFNLLLLFCISCWFTSCKKDVPVSYSIHYKLGGLYARCDKDSATYYPEGLKTLTLSANGQYCWTRVVYGNDSSYCTGTYKQTSDTSMLWNNEILIVFKITPIDSVPNRMQLQIYTSPAVAPLYGFYH